MDTYQYIAISAITPLTHSLTRTSEWCIYFSVAFFFSSLHSFLPLNHSVAMIGWIRWSIRAYDMRWQCSFDDDLLTWPVTNLLNLPAADSSIIIDARMWNADTFVGVAEMSASPRTKSMSALLEFPIWLKLNANENNLILDVTNNLNRTMFWYLFCVYSFPSMVYMILLQRRKYIVLNRNLYS